MITKNTYVIVNTSTNYTTENFLTIYPSYHSSIQLVEKMTLENKLTRVINLVGDNIFEVITTFTDEIAYNEYHSSPDFISFVEWLKENNQLITVLSNIDYAQL